VGVSVVNALSTELVLEVDRNDNHYELVFKDGGKAQGKLKSRGRHRAGALVPP